MAGEMETVGTEVKIDDLASTPLGRIAQSFDAVAKQASRANVAAANFSKASRAQPTGFAAAARVWGESPAALAGDARMPTKARRAAEQAAAAPAATEKDQFAQIREETRARRARIRGLKLEEQRGDILENGMGSLASALGAQQNVVGRLAGLGEQVGFQMSAFGGTLGNVGAKLVGVAGTVGLVAAGASIAYEGFKMLDDAFGITNWLVLGETRDEVTRRQQAYAKSLGYNSVEQMNAGLALVQSRQAEIRMGRKAEELARKLGGMPVDQTSEAMVAWEESLINAAKGTVAYGEDLKTLVEKTRAAAEGMSATWVKGANRQAELNALSQKMAMTVSYLHPMLEDGAAGQQAYNNAVAGMVAGAVKLGLIAPSEEKSVIDLITARGEEIDNIDNVIRKYEQQAAEQDEMNATLRMAKRRVHALSPVATSGQAFRTDREIAEAGREYARQLGEAATPEKISSFMQELKSGALERGRANYEFFKNSRFDIKQNFAEGFDPDRIAVAFTQDLVALGDRRLQSAHAPIFGSR